MSCQRIQILVTLNLFLFFMFGCHEQKPLFEKMEASTTGISFANIIEENDSVNVLNFDYIYNGSGVGVGDFNNDGLEDIFFTGSQVPSKLYINQGNFRFKDVTEEAGIQTLYWSTGVALVDINHDGLLDIYISTINPRIDRSSPNQFFISQGLGKDGIPFFKDMAKELGLADRGYSTQAAFFDYDKDGDLDMYLLTNALEYFDRNIPRGQRKDGIGRSTDRLYKNLGIQENKLPLFSNVSKEAGINIEGWGLGINISDINNDGWPDVYCANDFQSNDLLWLNNRDGTFTNQIASMLQHQSANSMGVDVADINNDGFAEIVNLDMMPDDNLRQKMMFGKPAFDRFELNQSHGYQPQYVRNMLQLNNGPDPNGKITFSDIGQMAGVHATDWSWSPLFADFDNDGFRDLLITNGYKKDVTNLDFINYNSQSAFSFEREELKERKKRLGQMEKLLGVKKSNFIFRNTGNLVFEDKTESWGLNLPSYSNGAAYADFDNDGDLDLVINTIDDPALVYKNNLIESPGPSVGQNYLRIKLVGTKQNSSGFGSRIEIESPTTKQVSEQSPYRGYVSTVEPIIHFGLGKDTLLHSVLVRWSDGRESFLENIRANQTITVDHSSSFVKASVDTTIHKPLFQRMVSILSSPVIHEENQFVDFKYQVLLPHLYSRNGPGMSVGDIDGNGLDDVYMGGASEHAGQFMFQKENGKFDLKKFSTKPKQEEDLGSLLFDADGDRDLDLYVVSGGNEFPENSKRYRDRLYVNDGKGNFTQDTTALPSLTGSGSCVNAADFDGDGDLDLFVGGRLRPRTYPLPAASYLLRNDHGKFTDVTSSLAPELETAGLVTSALWTDFNNDQLVDLIIVGEFMPITFYKNEDGKFHNVTGATTLPNTSGWWNSIAGGDFDNDGDIDYVVGNLGLNSRFKANEQEPICVYAKDYDGNGVIDPVMCCYNQGKNYPVHPRDQFSEQIPSFKKRFTSYESYGSKTIDEIIYPEERKDAYTASAVWMSSGYIENLGSNKFKINPLPVRSQTAPVFGIQIDDYDGDGNLDIILVGNSFATEVQVGRYDSFIGQLLKGNGKGEFDVISCKESGIMIPGDAKSMVIVATKDGPLLFAASNNDSLKVFESSVLKISTVKKLQPNDFFTTVTLKNGKKRKVEFYYCSGYLSQSSRIVIIPESAAIGSIRSFNESLK